MMTNSVFILVSTSCKCGYTQEENKIFNIRFNITEISKTTKLRCNANRLNNISFILFDFLSSPMMRTH